MNSLPSTARTYVRLLASSPDDACFCLLVGVVENWIQDMAERFPKTAASIPSAQLDFERTKELKMRAFVADFMEEYNSANNDGAPRGMSGVGRGVTSVAAAGRRSLTAASIEPRSSLPSSSSSAGGGVGGSPPPSRASSGGGRSSSDATMRGGNLAGLPPADVCTITFGRLGAFLHLALFHAWSDAICDNKKPLIEFPVDCLLGRYALPVVYFIAG
jgi:hypothetical protein